MMTKNWLAASLIAAALGIGPGCWEDSTEGDLGGTTSLALTQKAPVAGNAPCAGVCPVDPGAADSFRCVEVAQGVESCVPAKELLCSNNADDDLDTKVDCADEDCAQNPACLPAVCGDGNKEGAEECDDGNLVNGDGCSAQCQTEAPPQPVCGDGNKEGAEQCDDGNVNNGDGCSAQCQTEAPPPEAVTEVCDNGVDDEGDGKVDVADDECATKTVATFSVCVAANEVATISVLAGSGESIEGNYPGGNAGLCYPFQIDGADGFANVWVRSAWRKFASDHAFIIWDDGFSVPPPNWPQVQGVPVAPGSYTSASADVQWVNFYVAGTTE